MKIEQVTTAAQIERVVELAEGIWREHYTPIIGQAQVDYMLQRFQSSAAITTQIQNGLDYFLILETDNRDIGYFATQQKDQGLFISKYYVASQLRGNGYGKRGMQFIEQRAVELGLQKLWLTVNKDNHLAMAVYLKLGFENTGPTVQDIGNGFIMDDYIMEKMLGRGLVLD